MGTKPPIVITGARAPVALHMARLLGAAGHRVTTVDHLRYPLAAASGAAGAYRRIPSFATHAAAAGEALCEVISETRAELVIPTCEEVLHLAALWPRLDPGAALFSPDLAILEQVHDKYRFIALCNEIGLATPRTHLLTSQEAVAAHADTARDSVFKPVWSRFGARVLIRPNPSALSAVHPTPQAPWVAQSFVEGAEVCAYAVAHEGRITALSAYRSLVRAGPGAAICFAPVETGLVRAFVERFVDATQWTGQISFDLICTEDGRVLPLECNPRATSGLHFFADGSAMARAVFATAGEVQPGVTRPQAVRLALWAYGLPKLWRKASRGDVLCALRQAEDVMGGVGWGAQLRSATELAGLAMRHRIGLRAASTWGIEWNGPDQSSNP